MATRRCTKQKRREKPCDIGGGKEPGMMYFLLNEELFIYAYIS